MKKITIFTPTYNRTNTLDRLYESLVNQTDDNFLWLIVDDGSVDDTEQKILKWKNDKKILIEYYKQENRGKSFAHNVGVSLTQTELFTCVDSDDYLTENAISVILDALQNLEKNNLIGMIAFKALKNLELVTKFSNNEITYTTLYNAYNKYGLNGDTMLIYRTEIINKFAFPVFENEKFVPEAYLYDNLDHVGEMYIIRESLYICEYLQDGYTNNLINTLLNNPNGYIYYLKNRIEIDDAYLNKFKDIIKLLCFLIATLRFGEIKYMKYRSLMYLLIIICIPISLNRYGLPKKR